MKITTAAFLGGAMLFAQSLSFSTARADGLNDLRRDVNELQKRVAEQNIVITQISGVVNRQNQSIAHLQQQNAALQATLGCMSKNGMEVYFTGCNLHVVSGSGATVGTVNGLGNLIVGYNEDASLSGSPASQRGGSHNLIIGPGHSYTSYGGLVAGSGNSVLGPHASVSGGGTTSAATSRPVSVAAPVIPPRPWAPA